MERWRRRATAGAGGAGLLCAALILAPLLYNPAALALARWRWARRGGAAYRMVVTQYCNCYQSGRFELTVAAGQVVAVQAADGLAYHDVPPADPARFDHLTVEAAFDLAEANVREHWWPERYRRYFVEYDPALGYVRRLETGDPSVPHFFYIYYARDLHSLAP